MRRLLLIGIVVVLLLGMLVGGFVGISRKSNSKESADPIPDTLAMQWEAELLDVDYVPSPKFHPVTHGQFLWSRLPTFSQDFLFENLSSPQVNAFHWMEEDPNLETYDDDRVRQRFALAAIYFSLMADSASSDWLSHDLHECDWAILSDKPSSVETIIPVAPCGERGEQYQYLLMDDEGLKGTVPPEVGLLTSLVAIDFSSNSITGTLPSELGLLRKLQTFLAIENDLSGSIPSEVGDLPRLSTFALANNSMLSGTIPVFAKGSLGLIDVSGTAISGIVPSELCSMGSDSLIFDCGVDLCGCNCTCRQVAP